MSFDLSSAQDVFTLRRRAQRAAAAVGLDHQDQVRLATALSELGRERLGSTDLSVTFRLEDRQPAVVAVVLEWATGAPPAAESLQLASRLVRHVDYEPGEARDRTVVRQPVPARGIPYAEQRVRLTKALRDDTSASEIDDLRAQTHDLVTALEETRAQREELLRLNEELEETNKGVLALYSELTQELENTNSGVLALHTELADTSNQLREMNEARTRLWTNISHELRTPINAVVGLSRLLLTPDADALSAEQRRQVTLIAASGGTLLSLVNDLLDVAKAESGQVDVHIGPVDLRLLIGQLTGTLLSSHPGSHVKLITPESADLPVVTTDETLLTRILRNLLSNALKFTHQGEVRLTVDADRHRPAPHVRFTITDTGIGIPEEDLGHVFEEFYQVRGEHQRDWPGTGLGLPYARTLTELLGGTLILTSTHGTGTQVEVHIPDRGEGEPPGKRKDTADG
ncbi:sensor histidine kinase [Streptomyces sp. NPDC094038]|uniref:sensor histidine kinase n=1 Tax=Streptomyces sp. NPDC094038 TaxID=3366055 RepID=UPI003821A85B